MTGILRIGIRAVVPAAALAACATVVTLVVPAGSAALAATSPELKPVAYAGYHFEVPASWPVFDLSQQTAPCVRFDLHAVYLGAPPADEQCPSWLLGTTEAIVIQPGSRWAHRQTQEDVTSREIWASAPGIVVSATFDQQPSVIAQILVSAGLPAPVVTAAVVPPVSATPTDPGQQTAAEMTVSATQQVIAASVSSADPPPELPATVAAYMGMGFDTCTAPSDNVMLTWLRHSPYRAVGIYIGGADRACAQPNLTQSWVARQAERGWRFIPLYAGPQSALGQITAPKQQGRADAMDAVAQARRLGFGPGTPLYYDMEAYLPPQSLATLTFLSYWTLELHHLGYRAGVYSSSGSGIADLARQYHRHKYAIPFVIYDALWNGQANTNDPVFGPGEWTGGRRIHQFSGNVLQSFGGATMLIDQDFLDVVLPAATGTTQASAALMNSRGSATVFFPGPAHRLIEQSQRATGPWTRVNLGGDLTSLPSAVQVGSVTEVYFRGADGHLWERTHLGHRWLTPLRFSKLDLAGAPYAVAQPNGVVDVFWRGVADRLWHAQYDPGIGWAGPQDLGGALAGDPYPVESPSGRVEVFWGDSSGSLWRVFRNAGAGWSTPQHVGSRTLALPPQAAALSNNEIDVIFRGTTVPRWIQWIVLPQSGRGIGPVSTGALGKARPWIVAAAGREWILYRGWHGGLREVTRETFSRWSTTVWIPGGTLASGPFAATGPASGPLLVFWIDKNNQLWAQRFTKAAGFGAPVNLGGIGNV